MSLTLDDHMEVFLALDVEASKAMKAYEKARKACDQRPYNYGVTVEDNKVCVILHMREQQMQAARKICNEYFENYISGNIK